MAGVHPFFDSLAAFSILFRRGNGLQFFRQSRHHVFGQAVRQVKGNMLYRLQAVEVRQIPTAVPSPGNVPGNAILLNGVVANREIGVPGGVPRVWHREYWDRYIRDERHLRQAIEYIHQNPVKAGLIAKAESWLWSSARANREIGDPGKDANREIGDPNKNANREIGDPGGPGL